VITYAKPDLRVHPKAKVYECDERFRGKKNSASIVIQKRVINSATGQEMQPEIADLIKFDIHCKGIVINPKTQEIIENNLDFNRTLRKWPLAKERVYSDEDIEAMSAAEVHKLGKKYKFEGNALDIRIKLRSIVTNYYTYYAYGLTIAKRMIEAEIPTKHIREELSGICQEENHDEILREAYGGEIPPEPKEEDEEEGDFFEGLPPEGAEIDSAKLPEPEEEPEDEPDDKPADEPDFVPPLNIDETLKPGMFLDPDKGKPKKIHKNHHPGKCWCIDCIAKAGLKVNPKE